MAHHVTMKNNQSVVCGPTSVVCFYEMTQDVTMKKTQAVFPIGSKLSSVI